MKLLSKTCIYGIRAVLYLASLEEKSYVHIQKISEELKLSFHFLTKIFQTLTNKNLVISCRGPNGGVSLAKPAEQITLMEIIVALEGTEFFTGCILALPGCGNGKYCPLQSQWGDSRNKIKSTFEMTTLSDLEKRIAHAGLNSQVNFSLPDIKTTES